MDDLFKLRWDWVGLKMRHEKMKKIDFVLINLEATREIGLHETFFDDDYKDTLNLLLRDGVIEFHPDTRGVVRIKAREDGLKRLFRNAFGNWLIQDEG